MFDIPSVMWGTILQSVECMPGAALDELGNRGEDDRSNHGFFKIARFALENLPVSTLDAGPRSIAVFDRK